MNIPLRWRALALTALFVIAGSVAFAAGSQEGDTRPIEIVVAIHNDPGHPMFQVGERVKSNIEEMSGGTMVVTILGQEVGGERDHLEGVSNGEYTITLGGSVPMTLYAPRFAAADIPFVYSSSQEARAIYEGETGELLNEDLIENGNMRLVGLSLRNPRNLTSMFPAQTPSDIEGVRMRVPEIAPWIQVWGEVGALPSPIAWPEVYTSLQTGVIEMQENPVDTIYAARLFEVQDYVNRTEHVFSFFHWMINEEFYQQMSEADREIILSAISEATAWGDELVSSGEEELYERLRQEGMTIIEPEVALFREAAIPAIREIAESYHPSVREYVLSLVE